MDSDMAGGHESDYPEPNASRSSAYPVLSQIVNRQSASQGTPATTSSSQPVQSNVSATTANPGTALADAMRSYADQAQQWWSKQAQFGFGPSSSAKKSTVNQAADEQDAQPKYAGAPMANAFFGTSSSLGNYAGRIGQPETLGGERMPVDDALAEEEQIIYESSSTRGGRRRGGGYKGVLKRLEERNPALREPKEPKAPKGSRGRGRGRGSGRGRASRPVDPGWRFKEMQGKATQAFLEQDYEQAIVYAIEAIKANPEVFQAHSLYSEILTMVGRHEDSAAALMIGATLTRKAGPWLTAGQRTLDLAESPRPEAILRQALYCFNAARDCDADDYEARAGIMECCLELGDVNAARSQSRSMLRLRPDDLLNIRQHAELCADTGHHYEFLRAKSAYDEAFKLFTGHDTFGDPSDQWSHLNVYLELIDRVGVTLESVLQLRRLARWFLGRKEETFWDRYVDDDREFDSGHERRAYVGEFQQGRVSRDRSLYGDGLPLEIRVKLGLFRLKLGMTYHDEARAHLDHLLHLADQVEVYYDLFFIVADNLRKACLYKDAIKFYDPVERLPEVINEEFLMGVAQCYTQDSQYEEAEAHYLEVIENNSQHVESRVTLAKLYMYLEQSDKAKLLLKDVIKLGHKDLLKKENLDISEAQKELKQAQRKAGIEIKQAQRKAETVTKQARRRADLEAEIESLWDVDPSLERTDLAKLELADIQKELKKARRAAANVEDFLDPNFDRVDQGIFVPAGEGAFLELNLSNPDDTNARPSRHSDRKMSTDTLAEDVDDDKDESSYDEDDNDEEEDEDDGDVEARRGVTVSVDKAYILLHPEIEWVHRGGGRYMRSSAAPPRKSRQSRQRKSPKPPKSPKLRHRPFRPRLAANNRNRIRILEEQEPGVQREFAFVEELWPALDEAGDDDTIQQWSEHAQRLVTTFRSMDVFYTDRLYREFAGYTTRNINDVVGKRKEHGEAQAMLNQLEDGIDDRAASASTEAKKDTVPRHFHDISFHQWHRIFVDLALVYARQGHQEKCYDILSNALLRCNVFVHDAQLHNTSLAACICCGIMFNDSGYITDTARRYISLGDFRAAMPYQLFAAANRLCFVGNWFNAGPTQKFMLRTVKTYDHIQMPPEMRAKINWGAQYEGLESRLQKHGQGIGPEGLDVGVLAIYGHMVAEANFSHSALPYYFRAFALQPDNPNLNLCIAAVMVQNSMKRQTLNRQYGLHQALSFLFRYYELRTASGTARHVQEAEYNVARLWHLLGLTHLALPRYEQVLALSNDVQAEHEADGESEQNPEDFAQEAAFALQQIYMLAGNDEAARAISEEWLVL